MTQHTLVTILVFLGIVVAILWIAGRR